MKFEKPPDLSELLHQASEKANIPAAPDPDEPITASQFKAGDRVTFHEDTGGVLYLMVEHLDDTHAFLRRQFHHDTNEYRVSRRSSELRFFDKLGWTLVKGRFSHILAGYVSKGG